MESESSFRLDVAFGWQMRAVVLVGVSYLVHGARVEYTDFDVQLSRSMIFVITAYQSAQNITAAAELI